MKEKKLIIGLGTGRCGTVSLCNILNQLPSSFFVHEGFMLPWYGQPDIAISKLKKFLNDTDKCYVGDVGFYWLPYVEEVISVFPKTKFICLKRNKQDTINSYLKKTEGRNHWINHDGKFWRKDYIWDRCFPKYNVKTKEEALSLYWDEYYSKAYKLQLSYPNNFKIFDIEVLNSSEKFFEVLDFLEIPRFKITPVKLNTTEISVQKLSTIKPSLFKKIKTRWFVEKKFLPWRFANILEKRGGCLGYLLALLRKLYFYSKVKFTFDNYNIGVIVPIRDVEPFRLYHCLSSIKMQNFNVGKLDCLVVDYGSNYEFIDKYLEIVDLFNFKYLYVNFKRNDWSKAHALNIGLRNIFSSIVVISDVDIIFSPSFFQSSVEILKKEPCSVVYSYCLDLPEEVNSYLYSLYIKKENVDFHYLKNLGIKRWASLPSYGPLITYRFYFELIGGYDEFYKNWGTEDVDIHDRFLMLGLDDKILFDDCNFYCHIWHEKWGGLLTETKYKSIQINKVYKEKNKTLVRNDKKMGYVLKL